MFEITLILSIISIIFTGASLLFIKKMLYYTIEAKVEIEAMRRSTHTVQYIDPEVDKINAEFLREKERKLKLRQEAEARAQEPSESPDEDLFGF